MNKINITLTLCEEDRRRADELIASVNLLATVLGNAQPAEVQQKIIEEVTAPLQEAEVSVGLPVEGAAHLEPVNVEETPAPVAEKTEEVKPVSLAEFQKAVTLAVSKGAEAKKAAKEIINKYAASVSAVPEDKRAEVMAELANI
jgi:hypothetical protein